MKAFLAISLCVLVLGCTTKVPVIPKAPIVSESAVKDLKKTQSGIDTSLDDNKKIQEKLKSQEKTISAQKTEIQEALLQAEKIKEKVKKLEQVTSEDTYILVDQLKKVQARNLFLENETKELAKTNENQLKVLENTKKNAQETLEKLVKLESETKELRNQIDYLSENLAKKNGEILKLSKDLSNAKVYKNWIIGGVSFILLLLVGYIVLVFVKKSVNPLA